MRKRFYLFVSLFMALGLSVALTSALAQQKDKGKDKTRTAEAKAEAETPQVFTMQGQAGSGSYLGVYLEEVTAERVKELGLGEERGAIISKVVEGSPAEKAGLKENDVVVSFNDRRIDSVRELQRLLNETPAGRNVRLGVLRQGSEMEMAATLGEMHINMVMPRMAVRAATETRVRTAVRAATEPSPTMSAGAAGAG